MATKTIASAALFLLGSNLLKRHPPLLSPNSIHLFFRSHKIPLLKLHIYNTPSTLALKCFIINSSSKFANVINFDINKYYNYIIRKTDDTMSSMHDIQEKTLLQKLAKIITKALKPPQKPVMAVVLVALVFFTCNPTSSFAASGGIIGGQDFSSSSSSYSDSSSWPSSGENESSDVSPSQLFRPLKGSYAVTKKSYPVPSVERYAVTSKRSYMVPRSFLDESSSFSYSTSMAAPSQVRGRNTEAAVGVGLALAVFIILVFVSISDMLPNGGMLAQRISVLKLQVGLLGSGISLQKNLNQIAETADTSTKEGLSYILSETILALLQHHNYCISAYSSADVKRSMDEGETRFNELSIEERGKLDVETLVNVNNIKTQSSTIQATGGVSNEYIVVTILAAAEGERKLPIINGSSDLEEALLKLGRIPSSKTLAVKVIWTPQNEDDVLSERKFIEDYPLLRPL